MTANASRHKQREGQLSSQQLPGAGQQLFVRIRRVRRSTCSDGFMFLGQSC